MTKERKASISHEVMARLGEEGYCFNHEHDKEIDRLKAELAAIETKHKEEVAKLSKEIKDLSDIKEEHVAQLEKKNEEMTDAIRDLDEKADKFVTQLAFLKEDLLKEAKEKATCFDIFHRLLDNKSRIDLTIMELMSFVACLFLNGEQDLASGSITMFAPPVLKSAYERVMREGGPGYKQFIDLVRKMRESKTSSAPSSFGPMMSNKPKK